MNPALIKMALDAKTSLNKPEITGRTKHDAELAIYKAEQKSKNIKTGFKIIVGAGLIFGIFKGIKKLQHNNSSKDSSPEMLYAKSISASFGSNWDGTNEELLFETAYKIQKSGITFSKVQKAFYKLNNQDLLKRLQSEVSADEYSKFVNIVSNSNYKPDEDSHNPDYYSAGKIAVFKSSGGDIYKEKTDYWATIELEKAGFANFLITTGITDDVWLKFPTYHRGKMIKLKSYTSANEYWVIDSEVKLYPTSKIQELKSKGYTEYSVKN